MAASSGKENGNWWIFIRQQVSFKLGETKEIPIILSWWKKKLKPNPNARIVNVADTLYGEDGFPDESYREISNYLHKKTLIHLPIVNIKWFQGNKVSWPAPKRNSFVFLYIKCLHKQKYSPNDCSSQFCFSWYLCSLM